MNTLRQLNKRVHYPSDVRAKSHVADVDDWNLPELLPTLCGKRLNWTRWRALDRVEFPTCARCRDAAALRLSGTSETNYAH
jgi:hypothetical protein